MLRLLADWGARRGGGEPLRHELCGTALETRWWCPDLLGRDRRPGRPRDPLPLIVGRPGYTRNHDDGRPALGTGHAGARSTGGPGPGPAAEPAGPAAPVRARGGPDAAPAALRDAQRRRPHLRRHRHHRARARARRSAARWSSCAWPIALPLLVVTTADAVLRIWRSAWAWMPVDRTKGWFRLAWVVVSIIGLVALVVAGWIVLVGLMDEFERGARRPLDRPRLGWRRPGVDRDVAQLLLALRVDAALRDHRGRGSPSAVLRGLRSHRVRQPAPRRDDLPGHRRRRDRPDQARHRAGPGRVGPARRLPRGRRDGPPGGHPRDAGRRPACSSSRARSSGCTRGSRRRSSPSRSRPGSSAGRRPRRPRRPRSRPMHPSAIPWPDIAFRTTTWALRDWIDRRRPDLTWPERAHGR